MNGIRKLGRLGMRTLIAAFVVATISCGGPGSFGTVNQDFDTADEFFAGAFFGRVRVNDFQVATFTFTGTNIDVIDLSEGNEPKVDVVTDENVPTDTVVPLNDTVNVMTSGTFDSSNGQFSFEGSVELAPVAPSTVSTASTPVSVTGRAGGPFADDPGGTFTMSLDGNADGTTEIFTGTLLRGVPQD